MIELIVGVFIGALLGVFVSALFSAGKVADLEEENIALRNDFDIVYEKYYELRPSKDI